MSASSSTDAAPSGDDPRAVVREVVALWLFTLVLIRVVVEIVPRVGLPDLFLAAVPILFMYTPVWLCRIRGVDSWDYPLALPSLRDRAAWLGALRLDLAAIGVLAVPFVIAYHLWQTQVFGFEPRWVWPSEGAKLVVTQVFFVAIPEELFYRGYVQTRLDEVFSPRWRILGARLGPAWLATCVLFAFGHTVVRFQWWHFAIFFPSLVFGWMRARSGGVVAGALFHAWCNVTVTTLNTLYGIVPP